MSHLFRFGKPVERMANHHRLAFRWIVPCFRGQFGEDGVTTGGGPPVRDDTIVTFVTTLGRFEPAEAKTTDGKVTVRFVGGGRAGAATITAFSGAAVGELEITVTAAGDAAR